MNTWTPLIPVLLMLVAFSLRKFAPTGGWLHTIGGATLIAFISGLLGALAQAIQAHGFSSSVIVPAIASFIMSFIATANPSMGKTEEPTVTLPPGSSLRALLPLAFIALACASCATAGGKAMKACELGKLGSDAQIALTTGQAIASNPGSTTADLEQAALSFLPGQFECAMQALAAWWAAKPATTTPTESGPAAALVAAYHDAQRLHALDVLGQYLAAHKPTACAPLHVAELLAPPAVCDSTAQPPTDARACRKMACDSEDVDCGDVDARRAPLVRNPFRLSAL